MKKRFNPMVLFISLAFALLLACSQESSTEQSENNIGSTNTEKIIKIGYQAGSVLTYLKESGELETTLAKKNVKIQWYKFISGPPLTEALNAGSIDMGETGDTPPIFAQVAGIRFKYFAYEPTSPKMHTILVKDNSSIKSVKDLKGKSIAVAKGTDNHFKIIVALENSGLDPNKDVTLKFLTMADSPAAFENGSVDAWSVSGVGAFLTLESPSVRDILTEDDLKGSQLGMQFYLVSEDFLKDNPVIIDDVLKAIQVADKQLTDYPKVFAELLNETYKMHFDTVLASVKSKNYDAQYLTPEVIESQQRTADVFLKLNIIPKKINVADAVYQVTP